MSRRQRRQCVTSRVNTDLPGNGASDVHPAPFPHPFATNPETPGPPTGDPGYPGHLVERADNNSHAWPAAPFQAPPPPPAPKRRRGWLVIAAWIGGAALVLGLTLQAGTLVADAVTDAVQGSDFLADPVGAIYSDPYLVDGVEVVEVAEAWTLCASESCWEWVLMTEPECATATVTITFTNMYGNFPHEIERLVTVEPMTSIVVEAAEAEGDDYAQLTSISCK